MNNQLQHVTLRYAADASAVHAELERLANQTGRPLRRLGHWAFAQTKSSSVQGRWDSSFGLKAAEEQIKPLLKTQTHLVGLAPTDEPQPANK